ncbi:MAG TPA: glycosyltransferase, partial [Acidimicrobiales bacterium]|nr:glycosyltransferase [Acidimicrobiales bacterium]
RGESAAILAEAGAVVVPPENPAALASAIAELADDPGRRARMGADGRRAVVEHHDRRALASRYLDLLRGLA